MASPIQVLSVVLLVAGVTLMLVVHILVVIWALRRGMGNRAARGEGRAEEGSGRGRGCGGQGLSDDELGTLPSYDFKEKSAAAAGGADCAVCLEAFADGDRCRRLPRCEHSFHAPCVDPWLRRSRWCPVCRADVVERPERELKAAGASTGAVEMAEVRRIPATLVIDIVAENG